MSVTHQSEELPEADEPSLEDEGAEFEEVTWSDDPCQEAAAAVPIDPLATDSFEVLIAKVMNQDELALEALYARMGGAVFSLAFKVTRNFTTSEEVVQDVFWQVWRQAPRFDSKRGSVPAWILTMTRSRALDAARRYARAQHTQSQDFLELDEYVVSPDAGPQDLLFAAQQGSRLQAAMHKLDPLRRQLVSLSFFKGLTQQEISDQTGLPLGSVKSNLRRSLLALREDLGEDLVAV